MEGVDDWGPVRRWHMTVPLKHVAREAEVSYVTALRALGSSPGRVLPVTAERVQAAADRLGHRPNPAARTLTSRASPYVGAVRHRLRLVTGGSPSPK